MVTKSIEVTKIFRFEAAHKLPNYEGDCANLHGHSYKLEVTVRRAFGKALAFENEYDNDTSTLPATEYMVMDFKELSKIVKENIIKDVDHKYLNDIFEYPTAENMVYTFAEILHNKLPSNVFLVRVRLWETESSFAEYIETNEVISNV